MDIATATQSVIDRLTAGGVRAVLDERDINPPCVFVGPPTIKWRFRRGDYDAEFRAWVLAPNSGRNIALKSLGPLLEATAEALGMVTVTAEPADFSVADQAGPLPGYRIVWHEQINQP